MFARLAILVPWLVVVAGQPAQGAPPRSAVPPGSQLWAERLNDPYNGPDGAADLSVAPDGTRVYVTGWVEGVGGFDFETVAYATSTGRLVWSSRFDSGGYDTPVAMAMSPDGSHLYVTGRATPGGTHIGTVAYDAASGEQLWSAIYEDPLHSTDLPFTVAVSPDDTMVFVGGVTTQATGSPPTVIAYDAATGSERWVATTTREGDYFKLGVSPDSRLVFATGECCQGTTDDYLTAAYDAQTGAEAWHVQYDGPGQGQDAALDLAVAPDGTCVYVTGFSVGSLHDQYATIAYDAASGQTRWISRYDGPGHAGGFGYAVRTSPSGQTVFVTGERLASRRSYGTVAYDAATGKQQWTAAFASGGLFERNELAVSPDGSGVYVTGSGGSGSSYFYRTVAYDPATGALRWVADYTGPDQQEDDPHAIGTTVDGDLVFVTGQSFGPTDSDFATVAYRA